MELTLFRSDGDTAARYTLGNGETIIGRRPDCRIVLDAPSISPRHARLFTVDDHVVIHAIDNAWPVYVNGEPVRRQALSDGDEIQLGHYRIRCVDAASGGQFDDYPVPEAAAAAGGEPDTGDAARAASSPTPGPQTARDNVPYLDNARADDFAPPVDDAPVDDVVPAADDLDRAMNTSTPTRDDPDAAVDSTPAAAPDSGGFSTNYRLPDAVRDDVDDMPSPGLEPKTATAPKHEAGWDLEAEPEVGPAMAADSRPRDYHLDILTGINQGRRVALTRDRVVLGFNQQRLVEITNRDGTLSLRSIDDETAAHLNDEPITGEPVEARPGDVISLQRIDLRIHQDL